MISEISFLLSLLLDYKLPKAAQTLIRERIKDIEDSVPAPYVPLAMQQPAPPTIRRQPNKNAQSPSTQRILDEMAANGETLPNQTAVNPVIIQETPPPAPTHAIVVASPAAAAAMAARNAAINATSLPIGSHEKGRTSPRKF